MADKDLFQTVTESVVKHYLSPKEDRVDEQKKRKELQQERNPQLANKWFGLLPVSIKIIYYNHKR